jgi:hypothetical protein
VYFCLPTGRSGATKGEAAREKFDFPGTTMTDLANRTIAAAQSLYGNAVAKEVRDAFRARGIV